MPISTAGGVGILRQTSDPGAIGAGQLWYDSTNDILYVRNSTNSGWNMIDHAAQYFQQTAGISAPSTPSTGYRLYPKAYGQGSTLALLDQFGNTAMPFDACDWHTWQDIEFVSNSVSNTFHATTSQGTRSVIAHAADAYGYRQRYASAAVLNSDAGLNTGSAMTARVLNPIIECKFLFPETTLRRGYIGLFAGDPMASDAFTTAHFGIRVSTAAGSTQFVCTHADGVTQAEANIVAADAAIHRVRIVADDANTRFGFSFDGAAMVYVSTNIPASATALRWFSQVRTLDATPAARNIDITYAKGRQLSAA